MAALERCLGRFSSQLLSLVPFGAFGTAWPILKAGNLELSPLEVFTAPGEKVQKICRTFVEDSQMCSVFALVFASVFGLCWYQAFAPVVAGTDGRQIAIAWRDDQRKGNCRRGVEESRCRAAVAAIAYGEYRLSPFTRLRAAVLGTSGVRGAEMVRSSES